jgi:hypothetical protein
MKKKIITVMSLVVCISTLSLHGQDFNKAGRTAFQFVKIGVGARQVSMGEASLALVRDVNSIFWNPANTTGVISGEASFSYAQWFADLNYISGAAGYRWRNVGVFTLGYASLDYGDIPEAYAISPTGSSDSRTGNSFTGGDLMIGLSYAREFTENLSIGISAKFLQEKLFDYSFNLFAFDVGTYYDTGYNGIRLAMAAQNFGRSVKFIEDSDREEGYDIPLVFRIGLSADIIRSSNAFINLGEAHRLAVALDAIHSNDYAERMHFGAEYWYSEMIALRSGYRFNYDEGNWSVGIGLKHQLGSIGVRMDYAYTHFEFLESPHRFSLSFSF